MILINKVALYKKYGEPNKESYMNLASDIDYNYTNMVNRSYNRILDPDVFECREDLTKYLPLAYYLDVERCLLKINFLGEQTFINTTSRILISLMIMEFGRKLYWTSEELIRAYLDASGGVVLHRDSVENALSENMFFGVSDDGRYYLDFAQLQNTLGM